MSKGVDVPLLSQADRDVALFHIRRALMNSATPLPVLTGPIGQEGDDLIGSIPQGLSPNALAQEALNLLDDDGFKHIPPFLYRLLQAIAGAEAEVAALLERIKDPPPPAPDEFDEYLLWSRQVFLDRLPVRNAFRQLVGNGGNPAIVVVNGPPSSGKSFTAELAEHLAARRSDFTAIRISLLEDTGASMGPEQVAREIAMRIPARDVLRDDPPERTASDARWVLDVALWVLQLRVRLTPPKLWLVIDGYDHPDVPELTHVFLQNLMVEITKGTARGQVRLILLQYQRPLPVSVKGLVIPDDLSLDAIGELDLRDYFADVLNKYRPDHEPGVVETAVQAVLTGIGPKDDRLPRLQELVSEATHALIRQ